MSEWIPFYFVGPNGSGMIHSRKDWEEILFLYEQRIDDLRQAAQCWDDRAGRVKFSLCSSDDSPYQRIETLGAWADAKGMNLNPKAAA